VPDYTLIIRYHKKCCCIMTSGLLSGIQEPGIKTQQPGMANGCDHDPDLPQMGVIAWNLVSGV
jgi:hypothetical protein